MDEKRKFFRIKNKGEIQVRFAEQLLELIDISASSAAVVTELELPPCGIIELKINLFMMTLNYQLLKKRNPTTTILEFTDAAQIDKLLPVLKNFRKEQR